MEGCFADALHIPIYEPSLTKACKLGADEGPLAIKLKAVALRDAYAAGQAEVVNAHLDNELLPSGRRHRARLQLGDVEVLEVERVVGALKLTLRRGKQAGIHRVR